MRANISYQPKRHIAIIESARGFAALYVLLTHIIELKCYLHRRCDLRHYMGIVIFLYHAALH